MEFQSLKTWALVAISILGMGSVFAQQSLSSKEAVASIERLVADYEIQATEPGVAILIYQPGKILFKKGYGLANLERKIAINSRTTFELASCSKPFTAIAVLTLHDRNMLSIDEDVRKYLPELPEYHKNQPILIWDLLSHTSGLPEYLDWEIESKSGKSFVTNDDYLGQFKKQKEDFPSLFTSGARHSYCNSNYLVLALLVEKVSGKKFGQFLNEEIFQPTGMNDTFAFSSPEAIPKEIQPGSSRAVGYTWKSKKETWRATWGTPPDRDEKELVVGDGGIWTNLEDLLKWDKAIRDRKYLKAETWKLALEPATTRKGLPFSYGLGWMLEYDKPNRVKSFGHNGSWSGFSTSYWHSNQSDCTAILLSNRDEFDTDDFMAELQKIIQNYAK